MGGCRLQRFPTSIATGFPGLWIAPPSSPVPPCDDTTWPVALLPGCAVFTAGAAKPVNGDPTPSGSVEATTRRSGAPPCGHADGRFRPPPAARNGNEFRPPPERVAHLPRFPVQAALPTQVRGPSGVDPPARLRRGKLALPVVPCGPDGPLRGSDVNPLARTSADFPVSTTLRPLPPGSVPLDFLAVVAEDSPRETPLLGPTVSGKPSSWNPAASSSVMPTRC